jgi:excinuclease ABC subunit C
MRTKDMSERIETKLSELPASPGVYLMKDAAGVVIYIGKAASLRTRVRSYFQSQEGMTPRTQSLVAEIEDLEVIRTETEAEAFLVEDSLIKRHQPRFNVRLRDDKRYPYLKITDEPFPRVRVVRRRFADGARYFGPYTSAKSMRSTLKLAQKLFPIRTCTLDLPLTTPRRPCLNHHIGRCLGPCAELVSQVEYAHAVDSAALLFEGRITGLVRKLTDEMKQAAGRQEYERAAGLRDRVGALTRSLERQSVALPDLVDRDVVGLAIEEDLACALVFLVRGGRVSGRETFHLRAPATPSEAEVLAAFLTQYYASATSVPKEVLLPVEVEDQRRLSDWLSSFRGNHVKLHVPQRGEKRRLVELASKNARFALKGSKKVDVVRQAATGALVELAEVLSLSSFPQRIEAFDISNTSGSEATGSMVVFENGRPRRDAYRRFRVHISGKPDDYAMMAEVLRRRFLRGLAELNDPTVTQGKFSELPDLVLIDGGKGQLSVGVSVLKELNIEGLEAIGLAKRQEEIFTAGTSESILLPPKSDALLLLRQIRDEAHRFAISYHRRLRAKRSLSSVLDEVPGIGPKRKTALMKRFGSVKNLAASTADEISASTGVPAGLAERLLERLNR